MSHKEDAKEGIIKAALAKAATSNTATARGACCVALKSILLAQYVAHPHAMPHPSTRARFTCVPITSPIKRRKRN